MTKALSRTLSAKLDTYKSGQLPKVNSFDDILAPDVQRVATSLLHKEGVAVPIVSTMLNGLAAVSGINANANTLVMLAEELVDYVGPYPIEDVVLYLKRVSRGQYCKFYGQMSLPDLIRGFMEYDKERMDYITRNHDKIKRERNGTSSVRGQGTFLSPQIREGDDDTPREKQSLEWVLKTLYGLSDDQVNKAIESQKNKTESDNPSA